MGQIRLLGAVGISADGSVRRVGGPRVRTLLALLALQPGRVIGCDTLICGIWGDTLPADPANALQTLVKRVRALLPANAAVESSAGGYRLRIDADDVDLHRFTRLVAMGIEQLASGANARAAETLDAALALWQGEPFTDLAENADLYWHADHLNQSRLEAVEARADAYVALGRARAALDPLAWELRRNPLRESLAIRMIHALTATGQPARAREVFTATRTHLHNELGVPPSPELLAAVERITGGLGVRAGSPVEQIRRGAAARVDGAAKRVATSMAAEFGSAAARFGTSRAEDLGGSMDDRVDSRAAERVGSVAERVSASAAGEVGDGAAVPVGSPAAQTGCGAEVRVSDSAERVSTAERVSAVADHVGGATEQAGGVAARGGGAEAGVGSGVDGEPSGGAAGGIGGGAPGFAGVLPARLTRLIGREPALQRVGVILRETRLLTLVGPGGVGKTSLALEAATRLADRWADGCRLIELGAVGDAMTAVGVIRAELGLIGESAHMCPVHRPAVVGGGELLLILDNCEHVLEIAGLIAELLRGYPNLTVLATSREPLAIAGETLFSVAPLAAPAAGSAPAEALGSPAVHLFLDRARAIRDDFTMTGDNCATIAAICRRLDGIPLALELAAARVHTLTPAQILARLDDRFRLLSGNRAATARHRSLYTAIEWSWDSLTDPERRMAQRLWLFPEGATLEAVQELCRGDAAGPLGGLVSKSLVEFDGRRYRMLETIHAFVGSTVMSEHRVA